MYMKKGPRKPRQCSVRTVKSKAIKDECESPTKDLSSTLQISPEAFFEDLPEERETHLDITCPGQNPRRIKLGDESILIGRDNDCDIPLSITSASRHHASIAYNGEEYTISDLDSTNGVYINNIKISRCILRNHDLIRIGDAKLLFVREQVRG
ncbi:hypothetical protein BVX97_04870 [bacterium E08(2017)]|nr:hypothetical protein BVX97_04870 [bacterium E08(2017)]